PVARRTQGAGRLEDEGRVRLRAARLGAVARQPVLPELLAVVAGDDDGGVVVRARRAQDRDEARQQRILEGDGVEVAVHDRAALLRPGLHAHVMARVRVGTERGREAVAPRVREVRRVERDDVEGRRVRALRAALQLAYDPLVAARGGPGYGALVD